MPTGTTNGGLIGGDLISTGLVARLVLEEGDGKIPVATLYLKLPNSGQFVLLDPILTDQNTFSKYLLETKIAQTVNGVTTYTRLERFNLQMPAITEDQDLGWVLQVPCEHIAMERLKESYTALNQQIISPHDRVEDLLFYDNLYKTFPDVFINYTGSGSINLPDSDSLKRDYFPTSKILLDDAIQEVMDILQLEGAEGGVFENFYYWIDADPNNTMAFNIHFDQAGSVDSGVVLDPLNNIGALLNRNTQVSNKKRRNRIFVKYDAVSASLPMEKTRFASAFEHAKFRPEWSSSNSYNVGDNVMVTYTTLTPNVLRFFTCISAVSSGGGSTPDQDTVHWEEDFTIIPPWNQYAYYTIGEIVSYLSGGNVSFYSCSSIVGPTTTPPSSDPSHWISAMIPRSFTGYVPFYSYNPWLSDLQSVVTNLAALNKVSGYVGFAADWNYERQINDILDYTNKYTLVTGKSVRRIMSAPPTGREPYSGMRILVSSAPSGIFSGHANQIAEFYQDPLTFTNQWYFSNNPVEGDTITNIEQCAMMIFHSGAWTVVWGYDSSGVAHNLDKPGPFHAVASASLVMGATSIPGQAIRYRFNNKDASQGGNDINKTSRGWWYNHFYPYPILDNGSANIGAYYGGDGVHAPSNPMIDHQNLNYTRKGNALGNQGQDDEDGGRISAHAFKIRVGYYGNSDDSESSLVYGKANIAATYWRKDDNGRFFFQDFTIPQNGQWWPVTIQLPPFGPNNLYFNRLDELVQIFGYTLPVDIFIQEKVFAGVIYDWHSNQSWGVFGKDTYLSVGMYQGCYQSVIDTVSQSLNQIIPLTIQGIEDIATGNYSDLAERVQSDPLDHINVDIDELGYVKEGYAVWPDTIVSEPRSDVVDLTSETDHFTAKARAQAEYIKDNFFPNERYVDVTGNAGIYYGELVTETGIRVPNGSLQSLVANLKTTIDNRGFNQELYLIRKFVVS